jgi:cytoskeletal protein CcmA (bactofilin family)
MFAPALADTYLGGSMDRAHIGSSIFIKGEVFADEPLTIAGRVVGTIEVTGHPLTLTDGAKVEADIVAQSIVVAGTVSGTITAEGRIVVERTATIQGDLSAPTVSIQDGATVQGHLEVVGHRKPLALAS